MTALRTEVVITHPTGLHARPAVKFTKLAKTFPAEIRLRRAPDGEWVDAKSVVKVMGLKFRTGTMVELEARGRGRRGGAGRAARPGRARFRRDPWLSGSFAAAPPRRAWRSGRSCGCRGWRRHTPAKIEQQGEQLVRASRSNPASSARGSRLRSSALAGAGRACSRHATRWAPRSWSSSWRCSTTRP